MRDQIHCAPAIGAFALAIALCALYAGASGYVKAHGSRGWTEQLQPRPAHLIQCACFPDPGLQRLGIPQPLRLDPPPPAPLQLPPR